MTFPVWQCREDLFRAKNTRLFWLCFWSLVNAGWWMFANADLGVWVVFVHACICVSIKMVCCFRKSCCKVCHREEAEWCDSYVQLFCVYLLCTFIHFTVPWVPLWESQQWPLRSRNCWSFFWALPFGVFSRMSTAETMTKYTHFLLLRGIRETFPVLTLLFH